MNTTNHDLDADGLLTLANIVHVMLADGKIDDREMELLRSVAHRLGLLSTPTVEELLEIGMSMGNTFSSPRGPQLCLAECLRVASTDGEIHDAEIRAWKQLAISFGYSPTAAEAALKAGIEALATTPDPFDAIRLSLKP